MALNIVEFKKPKLTVEQKDMVRHLKRALKMAEEGKFTAMAMAAMQSDGGGHRWHAHDGTTDYALIGLLEWQKEGIIGKMELNDVDPKDDPA